MNHADVLVVGAGFAGLRCAQRLTELGHQVAVLEASDGPGGRQRTDHVDGFLLDRGFAILIPSYPAVRRWLDVDSLDLRPFGEGVLVRRDQGLAVVADPLRHPDRLLATLGSRYLHPRDVAALARWLAPVMVKPQRVISGPDTSLTQSFDDVGFTGKLRTEIFDPFLAGVVVESHGQTSANFVKLLARCLTLSRPGLPSRGMGAIGAQLADVLVEPVRYGEPAQAVEATTDGCLVHTDGDCWKAAAVVVAAGPVAGPALTHTPAPDMHGLVTWYFRTDLAPHPAPLLAIDGRRAGGRVPGPVWNAAVVSNAAPSYAPPGSHLVQATTLLDRPDGLADEAEVRAHLQQIYGCPTHEWSLLGRYEVRHALPAVPPPLTARRDQHVAPRVYAAGDHYDTSSIQGALVSGQRAAELVHTDLRRGTR